MSNISPYGAFTGRRLYSSSKIDNEIEEILHRLNKVEPYERMPTNPNLSPWVSQRAGHNPRAEWLREAKEWERGLVGTEDDKKLKQRILDRILKVEKGKVRVPGHLALIPSWKKVGGRTFKRYFGIDYVGGKHMAMLPDALRNLDRTMIGGLTNMATTTSGFQEAINSLSTQGTNTNYAQGGVLEVFPGLYTSSSPWQLPTSTTTAFDFTLQGGGKSNTLIQIAPSGTQTAAIAEGYTAWIKGVMGPRFVLRDLSMNVTGTYTGTTTVPGDTSGGGVISLQFYSVFFEHVLMSINVVLSSTTNLLKCGTYAGPSQPCDWYNFEIEGYASSNLANIVAAWFEGFSWQGGLVELQDNGNPSTGISIRSNGPNHVGTLDSYDDGKASTWMNFISPNGTCTLDEIEYPSLAQVYTGCNGGQVNVGSGGERVVIIGLDYASAADAGDPTQFAIFNEGCKGIKTIGFSLGLQSGAQWCPAYQQGPFDNNVASSGYLVGLNTYGGTTIPTAGTTYTVSTDLLINSSGGSGVSITIYDQFGNAILTGLTALSAFRMSIGMKIDFGSFIASPTVSIYQVSG
jgi:hypothetical protein